MPGRAKLDQRAYLVVIVHGEDSEGGTVATEDGALPVAADDMNAVLPRAEILDARHNPLPQAITPGSPDRKTPPAMPLRVLARDGSRCLICGARSDLMAHHIVFRSHGGPTHESNLASVCAGCHVLIHEGCIKMSGTAPSKLSITDQKGEPLQQPGPRPGPMLLVPELPAARDARSESDGTVQKRWSSPEVAAAALDEVPDVLTREWWEANQHRLVWNDRRRRFIQLPGTPRSSARRSEVAPNRKTGAPALP